MFLSLQDHFTAIHYGSTGKHGSGANIIFKLYTYPVPHIPLKNRLRPARKNSLRVTYYFKLFATRTEILREGRSLFFNVMCGYKWGLLRRLRGPYVIPRPGVPRHTMCPWETQWSLLVSLSIIDKVSIDVSCLFSYLSNLVMDKVYIYGSLSIYLI